MLFVLTMLLIIVLLIIIIHTRNKKKTPICLEKQITTAERIQSWVDKYHNHIIVAAIFVVLILFVLCVITFIPGTESGIWYNGGVENTIS